LKPERWGSPLVQEKYQGEMACDKGQQQQQRNNNNNNSSSSNNNNNNNNNNGLFQVYRCAYLQKGDDDIIIIKYSKDLVKICPF
jgi:hypothetical protein